MKQKITFSFGQNWQDYLKTFYNEDKLHEAIKSLQDFLQVKDLKGKTFLDIGCGTGMFSLAAYKMGAEKVTSFDMDPKSVKCCMMMRKMAGDPKNWTVLRASVLDKKIIASLPQFDVVYSWGVLHHTGKMWQAIQNAASLVKPDGVFYIAIYNKLGGKFGSNFWLKLKKRYNNSTFIGKKLIEWSFIGAFFAWNFLTFQNPFRKIKEYKSGRGMSWYYDVIDGLGGYPYEFASVEEIFHFFKDKLDFELENLKITNSIDNNEFLFRNTHQR